MPKTIHTPRDELICGKLDKAIERAREHGDVMLVELLQDVAHDADRMEVKLIQRKQEASRTVPMQGDEAYTEEMISKHADRADMFKPETEVIETRWVRLTGAPIQGEALCNLFREMDNAIQDMKILKGLGTIPEIWSDIKNIHASSLPQPVALSEDEACNVMVTALSNYTLHQGRFSDSAAHIVYHALLKHAHITKRS